MKLAIDLNSVQGSAGLGGVPNNLGPLVGSVLPYVFGISCFLLLIYMISGGLGIMMSRGDPKGIAMGQAKITNAILGFVVILLSAGLVVLIGRLLNIGVFSNLF